MPEKRSIRPDKNYSPASINIALAGGGDLCIELLEKTSLKRENGKIRARILAVSDPDSEAPGMQLARKLGLKTATDYHELYHPEFDIQLIIILDDDPQILTDILNTRPEHIRILSQNVFRLFWETIGIEERQLRKKNREVEAILNGIQDFILVISPQKEILNANEAFLKNMGYTRDEVIGRKCHEVFQKASQQCINDPMICPQNRLLRTKFPSQNIMTRVNRKGELRYIEITIYPIWKKDGKLSEFIEISRDITDRKKEEEEITRRLEHLVEERTRQLKETHDQLEHKDKMASLGKLAASVVHEINNPNAGILNLIMLIKRIIREGPVTEKEMADFGRYLDLMEKENRRISRIVSNLLSFSRQSKIELKRININRLINKTLMLNENLLKINGVSIKKELDASLPDYTGSEDHLQQVFMNFLSNAAEAMEMTEDAQLKIKTEYLLNEDTIRVSFIDKGIGIPRENVSKLFEPFYTTKKKGKGVGLGLSVAYGLIQEHNGSIKVESEPGKGTTFAILLPLGRFMSKNKLRRMK
jgi:PAS domain S-box-containing protein